MPLVMRMNWFGGNCQNFKIHQKALYLHSMPKGKNESLLLFVVPRAHRVAALNGCHWDAGHQGHDHTLSLLQEDFWWPGMTSQMQLSIRNCACCIQHEGGLPKAPLHCTVATAPLDLLHVDFNSIETTMEPNQSPRVTNILVFQDHFMKHLLVYVTLDQTAKSVAKFIYQGYISIFRAPARLRSDRGANFMSSMIKEMCKILSMMKLQTTPYHPQTNGLVERLHQMKMQMIRKLGEDKKAARLAITFAWNSTCLQCHPLCSYRVQSTLFNVQTKAKAPSLLLLPCHLQHQGPHKRDLHQACGWICSFCLVLIEDCPVGGKEPIDGRGMLTKMVLWLKDNQCEPETWWPGTSEGRCF